VHPEGPTTIRTYTGRDVDLLAPTAADICVEDIAHGLAMTCRFGGQCRKFASVACHSILVWKLVCEHSGSDAETQLAALFHDGHEAYLADVIKPHKRALKRTAGAVDPVGTLERRFDAAIAEMLGIDPRLFSHFLVKDADALALGIEASRNHRWDWPTGDSKPELPSGVRFFQYLPPWLAESYFKQCAIRALKNLTRQRLARS
jgi:hypothetical protein